nr:DUF308 domain-containing protein [uncultured Oscillibacter sp.]
MNGLFKRIKTNALVTAALYAVLGAVLLLWPELSTSVLCTALGLILLVCGLIDIAVFLRCRDGSLYAAAHLVIGVILAAVGVWLMARPTLVAVIIPRIIGVLICIHGVSDLGDAVTLRKNGSPRWTAALLLGLVTLVLGAVLVFDPFEAFTTVVRIIGVFLIYDGVSDIWITVQVSRTVRQAERDADASRNAVDVEYRDVKDE